MSATFVLVPGYWLGGWAWDRVVPGLADAGHRVSAVTLPGLGSVADDRSAVHLADHVAALAAVVAERGRDTVVVAHSGAGKVVTGLLDQDPGAVRRVVYVDSGPSADGAADDLPPELTEIALPPWDELQASLEGLGPADLATFRERAVPHPAAVAREPLRLSDPRRREVPSTIVACSLPSATVAELAAQGHPMFAEVARLTDVSWVDLPTGHWPMWSRPADLVDALLATAG